MFTGADQITAQSDGAQQTAQIDWLAAAGNNAPAITSAAIALALDGAAYRYSPTAFDADGDDLTYALLAGPAGMTIDPVSGAIDWNAAFGTYPVSISVTDPSGAADQQQFQLFADRAPVLGLLPVDLIPSDYQYVSRITATDADGDPLFYALVQGQAEFAINQQTGDIVSYSALPIGSYPITIRISDRRGGVLDYSYTLQVSGLNTAPTLAPSQTSFTVPAGDVVNLDLNVVDAEGDIVLVGVTDNGLVDFSVEPASGQATWASNLLDVGATRQATVIARDEWGAESAPLVLEFTATDNLPPTVTSTAPAVAYVDTLYEYQIVAVDPENRPLTYEVIRFPGFLVDVSDSGLLTMTPPSYTVNSNRSMEVRITDSAGHTLVHEIEFEVRPQNRFDPQLDGDLPRQAIVDFALSYQLLASDGDGTPVTFSLISGPSGMTVSAAGLIEWTPSAAQVGFQTVVVRLSDGERAVDVDWQIETLAEPLPLAANILVEPQFIGLGESATLTVQIVGGINPAIDSVTLDGAPITLSAGQATLTPNAIGRHPIVVNVLDESEITSFGSFVSVTDPSDVDAPTVAIESPAEGATVTALTDVIGTVQDANLVDVQLYARRAGSNDRFDLIGVPMRLRPNSSPSSTRLCCATASTRSCCKPPTSTTRPPRCRPPWSSKAASKSAISALPSKT